MWTTDVIHKRITPAPMRMGNCSERSALIVQIPAALECPVKLALTLLIAVLSMSPASAQEKSVTYGDGTTSLSAADKKLWRGVVEKAGYNCPYPGPMKEEGEDGRGKILRLHCIAINGNDISAWDMRIIMTDRLRIERW